MDTHRYAHKIIYTQREKANIALCVEKETSPFNTLLPSIYSSTVPGTCNIQNTQRSLSLQKSILVEDKPK